MIDARSACLKGAFPFGGQNSLRAVLQRRLSGNELVYGSPLGLKDSLLDVVPLPFGSIDGEHHELKKLQTV